MSASAACASDTSSARKSSRPTERQRTGPIAVTSAIRSAPLSSASISPISLPSPRTRDRPGRSTAAEPSSTSRTKSPRVASPHHRLAVLETNLGTDREQRLEQLAGQLGGPVRLLDELLVAAAVEEEWPTLAVAGELDVSEEERVVAAVVGADDARDEMRESSLDERRVVYELEGRDGGARLAGRCSTREVIREALLR